MSRMSDAINAMIQSAIASLKKLELSELTSFGRDKLTIRHASGGTIQFKNDGKVYYNGTEIGTSSSNLWEYDSVNDETQLITQTDIDVGGYELSTTNSGSIRIGTVSDSMLLNHDGANDHQILTTNNLKITPLGSLLISTGGSATLNGNDILTTSWSYDVSADGNGLSDLYSLDFHAFGGNISVGGTGVASVDLTNKWQWLIDQDLGGTSELLDVGGITMKTGYDESVLSDLAVATKGYVDGGNSTYLRQGGSATNDFNMSGNTLFFDSTSGDDCRIYDSSGKLMLMGESGLNLGRGYASKVVIGSSSVTFYDQIIMNSASINMNNNYIHSLPTPTMSYHAATKGYIDNGFLALSGGTLTGNLDINGNDLQTVGNISSNGDLTIAFPSGNNFKLQHLTGATFTFPSTDGTNGQALVTDGSGNLSFADGELVDDDTPQLGGDLDVNNNKIIAVSNGDIELQVQGTGVIKLTRLA